MKKQTQIDFVVTWVDDRDPAWRKERAKYSQDRGTDNREERYRDWELLKYWFRGVEKYAPWVRKIHFITWGHLPAWLDTSNPKLHIVKHEDYISKEYLPLFNCNPLEICLHKIEGLSENAVRQSVKRLVANGFLERYDSGIYYIPKQGSLLGKSYLDPLLVIMRKYVGNKSETYGYITGISFLSF